MHQFDSNLSIKDNFLQADEMEFAAWELAGHIHREEFRDSGHSKARTAWLMAEQTRLLLAALANCELLAIGIAIDDPAAELVAIPDAIFLASDLQPDLRNSTISAIGRTFSSIRVCRAASGIQCHLKEKTAIGRPSQLNVVVNAWNALKADIIGFLDWDNSAQNDAIREMVAKQFPNKFIEKRRIGESTIRRHRRLHPELFV